MILALLATFAFLGCVSQTAAFAIVGRQEPDQLTTRAVVDKRESGVFKIAVITDTFSVIYSEGDPSKATTAAFGFNFRIDYKNQLWGLCTTAVGKGNVNRCGLVANCIDKFGCTDGCGRTGSGLSTITCSTASAAFCATALLVPSDGVEEVSYIACGSQHNGLELYQGFTFTENSSATTVVRTISSSSTPTPTSAPDTSSTLSGTEPLLQNSPTAPVADSSSNSNNGDNLNVAAIAGGAVGALALLCGSFVAAIWLVRRNRANSTTSDASSSSSDKTLNDDGTSTEYLKPELEARALAELSGRGAVFEMGGAGVYRPPMTPVELPVPSPRVKGRR